MTTIYRLLPNGDPKSGMEKSDLTPPDCFTTSDQTETNHTFYKTGDESVLCGVWECAPCREEIDSYPVHEMMTVLSGSVTLTDEQRQPQTFTKGDTFFVAKGTRCIWEITETLRKYYMISG